MKRSRLKRGTKRLATRKALRRSSKLSAQKSMQRGISKLSRGKRLRRVGARAKRERPELDKNRRESKARSGGVCARCKRVRRTDTHHVKGKAQRDRGENIHALSNLRELCRACHDECTFENPPDRAQWVSSRKGAQHA